MTGAPSKKPRWVLPGSRGVAMFFAIFFTVFAVFEWYEVVAHGRWWDWLLAFWFLILSALGWASLIWAVRHPTSAPESTPPTRAEERDDG
ncbi:hypothetical protein [Leifsonia sp. 22587]|uniref:hypothetical protein n=1 Tax=Leifsonia sp. 22587 TaxID=3453946 RepID=UPI003F8426E5